MAKNTEAAAATSPPPPLPATAHHAAPDLNVVPPAEVAQVPVVDVSGVQMEAHPVGTAQYIADLETENAQALADKEAVIGRATEGFKQVAVTAITHGAVMAGHLPLDINAIPGIDAINAAGGAPQG